MVSLDVAIAFGSPNLRVLRYFYVSLSEVMRTELNLPPFDARIRRDPGGKEEIFDPLRKKFVALTPEEWVRQHMVHFMLRHLGYPASLMAAESAVRYHSRKKRSDVLVHGKDGKPAMIVECKASHVPLTRDVLEQAAMYNMPMQVKYLVLTNGIDLQILFINRDEQKIEIRERFPRHDEL
jgi:hypothetical protein